MESPFISSEKYTLRPFKKEDAVLWQTWDIDPVVQAHMPELKNTPQDIQEQYKYIEECEKDPEGYYWSIETVGDTVANVGASTTIGTVSLFEINSHHKTGELGIVIGDTNYWGKGVAVEVLQMLIPYAFENLDIVRISAEVEVDNIPMQKVLEKVGFTQDGLFKSARVKNGKRIDVFHYGITK